MDKQETWSIEDLEDAGLPTTCSVCGEGLMDDVDWGFLGEPRVPTHLDCAVTMTTAPQRTPPAPLPSLRRPKRKQASPLFSYDFAPTIRLSPKQLNLLTMDSYGEYAEPTPMPELADLRREICSGTVIHLSPVVMAHLAELADRDQDPKEQAVYRRLLKKILRTATAKELGL